MRRKHFLFLLALLCAGTQGAWADTWDGSISQPSYDSSRGVYVINTGAELAYIHQHWSDWYKNSYSLEEDLDLSRFVWIPLGQGGSQYEGTFYGNGHTIELVIENATANYQGLFADIDSDGRVMDLHVSGNIQCKDSRLVGGIAGQNDGIISNCWVSANVSSNWTSWESITAKVGGIVGENNGIVELCCMTGDVVNHDADVGGVAGYNSGSARVNHCTFYGNRYSNHKQDNVYVGDQNGTMWNTHGNDLLDDGTLNDYLSSIRNIQGCDLYRFAIQYPYPVDLANSGSGALEYAFPGAREGKTVKLTKAYGLLRDLSITDAWGNKITPGGNDTDGYTFTMPRHGVFVRTTFSGKSWLETYTGTESDPFRISSSYEWHVFAYYVRAGYNFYQKFVKLTRDVTITETVGLGESFPYGMRPFCGTFLGEGHTLTANLSSTATGTGWNEQGVAPFHFIFGATIKDLTVAGTINSASYHTAGIVGFAYDNNLIENCTVKATLNISSNYAGGFIGHGENSATTIKDCVFAGTINGVGAGRANVGGFWGWSNSGNPVFDNCLEKGTYTNITSMHPIGLHGASGSISNSYYLNPQVGTPDLVSTVAGAYQIHAAVPEGKVYKQITATDKKAYYLSCDVSGLQQQYFLTSNAVVPQCDVTFGGKPLFENIDYSASYANNTKPGNATVTITGKGEYKGQQSIPFNIADARIIDNWWVDFGPPNLELFDGTYIVKGNVDCTWQSFYIKGNARLILSEGSTLTCRYGIELDEGRTLTIEGPGNLVVTSGAEEKAGIGGYRMGTLIINGGHIDVTGGKYAAAIGGSKHNSGGGRVVINGGVVKATGGQGAAAIGGGCNDWAGNYGVCGDIVINGGQITAISGGDGATAIGHGQGRGNETGSLTLGWTNPDDYLQATSIGIDKVTFTPGKPLVFEGTNTSVSFDAIRNGRELKEKIVPYVELPVLSGQGTSDNPYNINSADDWKRFTENVNYGNNYSGKFVRLNADITVSEKCGYVTGNTPSKAFSGTFLGQNHIITANIYDKHNQGAAVFSYIKDATIKEVNVAGTINSANFHSAGLVGFADGTNTIENCIVNATLHIRSDYAGGIVGHGLTSATTIKDCAFVGTINGVGANRANIGGIWGWSDSGAPTLVNCLEIGAYTNISSMDPMGLQNDKGTISLCYYKNPRIGTPANACTVSGACQLSDKALEGEISLQIELKDNKYYIPCVISSIEEFYELPQGGFTINPTVTFHGGNLSRGNDYTVTLDNQALGSSPISVTTTGKHTLIISGANGFIGSKTFNFEVFNPIEGEGTQDKPYVIRNANEWNLFATLVNRGTDFNGQFVKLGDDMTVTTMAGVSAEKAFKGTFLGDGKTLTVNIGTASAPFGEDYCAPFRYTNGATIQNLKVAGDIYTYKKFGAGLVAACHGETAITNCLVSTVIHSSTEGDGTHAGLVALPYGPLTITDCIYGGRLLTTRETQYCGGFVGWHHGQTIAVSSSLYAPDAALSSSPAEKDITVGATFVRGGSVGTDCFYSQALGDAQGTKIYDAPVAGELCMKAQAADGKWYYLPVTVSGIDATYTMDGNPVSITPSVTGYGTINPTLNDDYTATLNGNTTSFPLNITAHGNYTLVLTARNASTDYSGSKTIKFVVSQALAGQGTAESPYLISSEDDWNLFATSVAKGQNYQDKIFRLNADISVSTMVGTSPALSFQGTFLGDNHTLTFTAGSPENPVTEDYCAPFRYVSSDTIQNLKVAGHIYTSKKYAAGLIGQSSGTSTIEGCQVSIVIHSSTSGEGNHGGIVALTASPLTITDCVCNGRLLTTNGTTHCGGFVGSANGQDIALSSSLYAPNTALALSDGETDITDGATFVSGGNAGKYCYYTTPLGEAQGIQVSNNRPDGELCMQAQAADGNWYYLPCAVSGINSAYDQEADISITPVVTGLDNTVLTFGTDFTVLLDGNAVASLPISVTSKGDHTLTLTGQTEKYSGSKIIPFVVAASFEGEGTEAQPYLISSTTDWAMLASKVASGTDCSGKYVSLTDDIVITTPVGEREDKPFSGIFLGNGKMLTADLSNTNAEAQGIAPFRYIKDATIQNVTVAGTIASNSPHTAGLVGFAEGTNLIEGCTVNATLNVGSDYAGGFIGHGMTSATTIRGSIFAGTINGMGGNRSNMAGFWGWSDSGTPVLENCLEKGTYTNVSSLHPIGLQNKAGTITNCYYLTAAKGSPDHACIVSGAWQVSTNASADEIYKKVTAVDDATYYMLCTVSDDASKTYQVTGQVITIPAPVITAADNSALTHGTDFSYATNPDIVKDKGDYTLTITAKGIYTGMKSIPFSVSSNLAVTSSTTVMTTGSYTVYENITINERITISGDVVLNLGEGTKLIVPKGIELSKGNKLTINGPGELDINYNGDYAGIGAVEVGTLVINGGNINSFGNYGAAIGGSKNNTSGGSITINGGDVFAMGYFYNDRGAAIGGGYADQPGNYGVCGDIVINGGKVTALALPIGIGPGYHADEASRSNSGSLKLGWTNPDDHVNISRLDNAIGGTHVQSISFAPGKRFIDINTQKIPKVTIEDLNRLNLAPLLAPTDDGNNSELISACNGMKLPVMLDGRTLYKDGSWNTLCLPFDLTLSGSPLDGAVARPLESANISGSTLNLTFGDAVDALVAGTPYIIKWADGDNIESPIFKGMTIDATDRSYDNAVSDDYRVRFLGTYESTMFSAEDRSILLMGEKNTLYYPTIGAGIGAQRAYFKIGGDGAQAQANARRLKAYNINFGEDEVTGIISLTPDTSTVGEMSDWWYTLDGRRIAGKPAQSGVFINNGKKVMIK